MTAAERVPKLIVGVGALHVAVGFSRTEPWEEMVRAGVFNSIDDGARGSAFWFVIAGVVLMALGALTAHIVRVTGTIPAQVGWWLIVPALAVILVMPASGAYLNVVLGVYALRVARHSMDGDLRAAH